MTTIENQDPLVFDLQRLRFERVSRKYPVDELSTLLGISRNAYYKKERGATNITVKELAVILTALQIPRSEIQLFFTPTPMA